jgi:hypothetical protein
MACSSSGKSALGHQPFSATRFRSLIATIRPELGNTINRWLIKKEKPLREVAGASLANREVAQSWNVTIAVPPGSSSTSTIPIVIHIVMPIISIASIAI